MNEKKFRFEQIPVSDIQVIPEWDPTPDAHFVKLYTDALNGDLPVYFAAIPSKLLRRFDHTCRPEITVNGRKIVEAISRTWRNGEFSTIWVYESDGYFISSDNYFVFAAIEQGKPDYCPCYVLGLPTNSNARDVQGPIDRNALRKSLGLK